MTGMGRAREQLALQAQLLDEVDAAVILLDVSSKPGLVRYWSAGAQRLYGYTSEEAVGRPLLELVMTEQSHAAALGHSEQVARGEMVEDELELHDKHGRVFPVSVRIRPVPPAAGVGPPSVITVSVDISARREAEAAVRRHAEAQQEIVELGRLALRGGCMEELLDRAVGAAARVLSGDCAELLEHIPDTQDLMFAAGAGWAEEHRGKLISSEGPSPLEQVASAGGQVVVQDWKRERRVQASRMLIGRGVRSTVAVVVGDLDSPLWGSRGPLHAQPGPFRRTVRRSSMRSRTSWRTRCAAGRCR